MSSTRQRRRVSFAKAPKKSVGFTFMALNIHESVYNAIHILCFTSSSSPRRDALRAITVRRAGLQQSSPSNRSSVILTGFPGTQARSSRRRQSGWSGPRAAHGLRPRFQALRRLCLDAGIFATPRGALGDAGGAGPVAAKRRRGSPFRELGCGRQWIVERGGGRERTEGAIRRTPCWWPSLLEVSLIGARPAAGGALDGSRRSPDPQLRFGAAEGNRTRTRRP